MSSKISAPAKRKELLAREQVLMNNIERETTALESTARSSLKILAVAGAGLLAVTVVYKLLEPEGSDRKPSKIKKNKASKYVKPSTVTTSIFSLLIQKLLPLAIEKISSIKSKNTTDEQAAQSTSK